MRTPQQKTTNQTFSLPIEVSAELHAYVKRREMSRFVANAIRKELERKKDELRLAYMQVDKDAGQKEAMKDWEGTVADGSEDW